MNARTSIWWPSSARCLPWYSRRSRGFYSVEDAATTRAGSGWPEKTQHLLDHRCVADDAVVPQPARRHQHRSRPRRGNRGAVIPAHFTVIPVVNDEEGNPHRRREPGDINPSPFKTKAAFEPLPHG